MPDKPIPPPGTIAYAELKRKQRALEVEASPTQTEESPPSVPGTQESGKPGKRETGREVSQEEGQEEGQEGSKGAKKENGREVTQEDSKGGGRETGQGTALEEKPTFKTSFLFTEEEFELFDDLKLDLRRTHGLRTTKNDLARAGIRLLAEDYEQNRKTSFLVRKFPGKMGRK